MKTENTLRTVRNSLLCFFTALGAGFLVACGGGGGGVAGGGGGGGGGGGASTFPAYLFDSAVKGVEYSGPTGSGSTGNGGVFTASDGGMFEFSIGATTLGSVQVNRDLPYVTPADFDGVDEDGVIAIARIMQGLDGNTPEDGISIPRSASTDTTDLLARLASAGTDEIPSFPIGGESYEIPSVTDATGHFEDTRNCLFSGGYVGSYRATVGATFDDPDEGKSYLVLDLFADEARKIDVSAVGVTNTFEMFGSVGSIGVIGSTITLSDGNEFSFVTPLMVTGIYTTVDADTGVTIEAGTNSYAFVAGSPRATRRIAGFETDGASVVAMYVLDHFANDADDANDDDFLGQYYDLQNDEVFTLSLTIADGSWSGDALTMTTGLTLSGTRGDESTTVIMGVIRNDVYSGIFEPVDGSGQTLSGTWCDIAGSAGRALYQLPATPTMLTVDARRGETMVDVTWAEVPGATSYKLYRSTVSSGDYAQVGGDISEPLYEDSGLSEGTEYYYRLEACNFDGCSAPSSPVSDITAPVAPAAPTVTAVSSTQIDISWDEVPGATSYAISRSETSGGVYRSVISLIGRSHQDTGLGSGIEYFYVLNACNSGGCSDESPESSATTN